MKIRVVSEVLLLNNFLFICFHVLLYQSSSLFRIAFRLCKQFIIHFSKCKEKKAFLANLQLNHNTIDNYDQLVNVNINL